MSGLAVDPLAEQYYPIAPGQVIPVLLQYPLFATNIKLLCGKGAPGVEKKNAFVQPFSDIGHTIGQHGILSIYRGGHLYFLHLVLRDLLRFTIDRGTRHIFARKVLPSTTPQEASILGTWCKGDLTLTISKTTDGQLQYKEGDISGVLSAVGDKFQGVDDTRRVGYYPEMKQLVLERRKQARSSQWSPPLSMDLAPEEVEDCVIQVADEKRQVRLFKNYYFVRLGIRYAIDAVIYPVLLACTHRIILDDFKSAGQHILGLTSKEGILAMFNGLTATLLMAICDDAAEAACSASIDAIDFGSASLPPADKFLLKTCAAQVAGVLTQQIGYVGVVQRCQSDKVEGLLAPRCIPSVLWNLQWSSTFFQLLLFTGVFGLNVQLLKLKAETERQQEEDMRMQQRYYRPGTE